jgi:hypothetical protein
MASSLFLTSLILFGQLDSPASKFGQALGTFLFLLLIVLLLWKGFGGKKQE